MNIDMIEGWRGTPVRVAISKGSGVAAVLDVRDSAQGTDTLGIVRTDVAQSHDISSGDVGQDRATKVLLVIAWVTALLTALGVAADWLNFVWGR
jgi:hypothetical protein